jgi:hypothetical protein
VHSAKAEAIPALGYAANMASASVPPAAVPAIDFSTVTPAELPQLYESLPKNAAGLVELKSFLTFERALVTTRGGEWDVEKKLEELEAYARHEELIEVGTKQS